MRLASKWMKLGKEELMAHKVTKRKVDLEQELEGFFPSITTPADRREVERYLRENSVEYDPKELGCALTALVKREILAIYMGTEDLVLFGHPGQ